MSRNIIVKRKRNKSLTNKNYLLDKIEDWVAFWRANPHRFISDYLGLPFKAEFQSVLIYYMDRQPNFIYAASRGLAKL